MGLPVDVIDEPKAGTATWLVPPAVNEIFPYRDGAVWLGRNGDDARTPVGRKDDSHVLLCAMSRSGKGRALITNNLLLWKGSLVCNDPKGENASVCAARRGQGSKHVTKPMGQKVCVLDSYGTAKVEDQYRAYYNVLDELDVNDPNTASKAGDIVTSFITESVRKDPTWDEMAIPYMKALLLHLVSAPLPQHELDGRIPKSARDLITFRKLIQSGNVFGMAALRELKTRGQIEEVPKSAQENLLRVMAKNPAFDGIIALEAESLLESLKVQPKLWNSIRIAAATATAWIDDQQIRKVLRAGIYSNTFRASELELDSKGVSVFVCLKLKDQKKLAAWPRMIMNMVLASAQDEYFREPASGHSTLLMFDEFAALEKMQSVEDAAPAIAGAGVKLFLVAQNLSQLKAVYGENFEAFIANAGTQIYYGFNDNFTAEYVQKRLGEIEVIRTMRSGSSAQTTGQTITDTQGGSTSQGTTENFTRNSSVTSGRGGASGENSNYGDSSNTTHGWGPSLFHLSLITTKQESSGRSSNRGKSWQSSWQKAKMRGWSRSRGATNTETENWSRAVANQRSETNTEGWQQTLQRKPLAAIHELMQLFGTIDNDQEPNYPGIGLVSTAEKAPALIQKCFYDEDPFFEGMFDPHPKHGIRVAKVVVEAPVLEDKKEPLQQLHVCLNVSEDAFKEQAAKDWLPRFEMRPRPTVSDPSAHGRYYHDRLIILPHGGLKEGSRFKKGDPIADYHYGILTIGWLEKRHHIHTLFAPADGHITAIHDFGWQTTVNGETVPIKNEEELSEIKTARQAVDGGSIAPVERSKAQIEFVLNGSPEDAGLIEFRDYASAYVEIFFDEKQTEMELDYAEDQPKEFKALLPFSAVGVAALVYLLFFVEAGWSLLFLAAFAFIGLAALRVPEELLVGLLKLFNPWNAVRWVFTGFRIAGAEREAQAKRKHEHASNRLLAAKRVLNFPLET